MTIDPFDPQLLADYHYFCGRFGAMPLPGFIELWQAAGDLLETVAEAGLSPEKMPERFFAAGA